MKIFQKFGDWNKVTKKLLDENTMPKIPKKVFPMKEYSASLKLFDSKKESPKKNLKSQFDKLNFEGLDKLNDKLRKI